VSGNSELGALGIPKGQAKLRRVAADACGLWQVRLPSSSAATLTHLSLVNNNLREIPDVSLATSLVQLNVAHNNICRGFAQLGGLAELETINLAHNSLDMPTLSDLHHHLLYPLRRAGSVVSLDLTGNDDGLPSRTQHAVLVTLDTLSFYNGEAIRPGDRRKAMRAAKDVAPGITPVSEAPGAAAKPPRMPRTSRLASSFGPMIELPDAVDRARLDEARSAMLPVYGAREKSVVTVITKRMLELFFVEPLGDLAYPVFLDLAYSHFRLDSIDITKFMDDVLEELNLNGNSLVSAGQLNRFTRLRRLRVADNRLRSFSVSGFRCLQLLDLRGNQLRSIPTGGAGAPLLQTLDLAQNSISGGFEELAAYRSLRRVNLGDNAISGSLAQLSQYILEPLRQCAHLEYVNFDNNPIATSGGISNFVYFVVHELPGLVWYHNMFITEKMREFGRERDRARDWRARAEKAAPLADVSPYDGDDYYYNTGGGGAAAGGAQPKIRGRFDVPRAMNLLAQIAADDHSLKPIPRLHKMCDDFLEVPPKKRSFQLERGADTENEITAEESLSTLLKTAQSVFEKNEAHRREILTMLTKLSGATNENLDQFCSQIINVLLLSVTDAEHVEMCEVVKRAYVRLLTPQFGNDVHSVTVRNLSNLVPFHESLAADCCDDPSMVSALVEVMREKELSTGDALMVTYDLYLLLLRKAYDRGASAATITEAMASGEDLPEELARGVSLASTAGAAAAWGRYATYASFESSPLLHDLSEAMYATEDDQDDIAVVSAVRRPSGRATRRETDDEEVFDLEADVASTAALGVPKKKKKKKRLNRAAAAKAEAAVTEVRRRRTEITHSYKVGEVVEWVLSSRKKPFPRGTLRSTAMAVSAVVREFPDLAEPLVAACSRVAIAVNKALVKLGFADEPMDLADPVGTNDTLLSWILLGHGLLVHPGCREALADAGLHDSLAVLVTAVPTPRAPHLRLFIAASKTLALMCRRSQRIVRSLRSAHPGLPSVCMKVIRRRSEVHILLQRRWIGQGVEEAIAMDRRNFDALAEILLRLTEQMPAEDDSPSTLKRNAVLEEVLSEQPNSRIGRQITEVLGLQPHTGWIATWKRNAVFRQ